MAWQRRPWRQRSSIKNGLATAAWLAFSTAPACAADRAPVPPLQPSAPRANQSAGLKPGPSQPATKQRSGASSTASTPRAAHKLVSGSLQGNIVEAETGQPVRQAKITLRRPGKRLECETSTSGTFLLEKIPAGEWQVTASAPGMLSQTQRIRIAANSMQALDLALESTELSETVQVKGSRTLINKNVVGSNTHLDRDFLEKYKSGNSLREVITSAPGVTQDSVGNIVTRGEHNAVNYEIDGAILPEAAGVLQQGQFASPRSLQSVDVETGGFEAKDGGGPMGAIVKMRSLPIAAKPTFNFGTQLGGPMNGGMNFYGSTALSQDPNSIWNKVRVESSGSVFATKLGMQAPARQFRRDGRVDINILNKVEFRPTERDTFRITGGINESFLHIPTPVASRQDGVKINEHDRQNYVIVSYQHRFEKWLDAANLHIINSFYSQRFHSNNVFDPAPIINGDGFLRSAAPTARRYNYVLSIQGDVSKTVGTHHLLAGFLSEMRPVRTRFESYYYNANPFNGIPTGVLISPFTNLPGGPQFVNGIGNYRGFRYLQSAYLQDAWRPTEGWAKRLTLEAGVRLDVDHGVFGNTLKLADTIATIAGVGPFSITPFLKHRLTDAQVSGRYGGSFLLTKRTILRASYANLFNPAPVDIFVGPFLVTGGADPFSGIFNGAPRPLRPTRGQQAETSIEHQVGPRFAVRTNLFYKKLKNFGDSGVMDNTLVYNRLTLSGQEAYGVETRLDLKPSRDGFGFHGFVSNTVAVAYLRGSRKNTGGIWDVTNAPVTTKFPDHDRREFLTAALGYTAHNGLWVFPNVTAATGFKNDLNPLIFGAHPARSRPWAVVGLNAGWQIPPAVRKNRSYIPTNVEVRIENLADTIMPINQGSPYQGTRYTIPIRVTSGLYWKV